MKPSPNYGDQLLREEGSAILRWLIDGARAFHANGNRLPDEPGRVRQATEAYRIGEDWLNNFLDERCEINQSYCVAGGSLYDDYREWAKSSGEYARRTQDFAQALEAAGFTRRRTMHGRYWDGLKLVPQQSANAYQSS